MKTLHTEGSMLIRLSTLSLPSLLLICLENSSFSLISVIAIKDIVELLLVFCEKKLFSLTSHLKHNHHRLLVNGKVMRCTM